MRKAISIMCIAMFLSIITGCNASAVDITVDDYTPTIMPVEIDEKEIQPEIESHKVDEDIKESRLDETEISLSQLDFADYIPLLENAVYEFQACFFTNSTYSISHHKIDFIDENYGNVKIMQITEQHEDGDDYATYLYVFMDKGIYRYDLNLGVELPDLREYFTNEEIDEVFEKSYENNPMIYYPFIKAPIKVGTTWDKPFNQRNHYGQIIKGEITGIDIPLETTLGTLKTLEITIKTPNGYYEKYYYAKGIGLVRTDYGNYDVYDSGEEASPYTIKLLTTLHGYNREYNGTFYKDLRVFAENQQVKFSKEGAIEILLNFIYKDKTNFMFPRLENYDAHNRYRYKLYWRDDEPSYPIEIEFVGFSSDDNFYIFRLYECIYYNDEFDHEVTLDFYAVNKNTGEIIAQRDDNLPDEWNDKFPW